MTRAQRADATESILYVKNEAKNIISQDPSGLVSVANIYVK